VANRLLLIPGVFLGGIACGNLAKRIPAARMRRIFASLMFLLGIWQVFSGSPRMMDSRIMIDLHCHILSGMDDGARALKSRWQWRKMAISDGITHVVATRIRTTNTV